MLRIGQEKPGARRRFTVLLCFFFFSSRRRHTRCLSDWSSDVCSSDLDETELDRANSYDVDLAIKVRLRSKPALARWSCSFGRHAEGKVTRGRGSWPIPVRK